MLSVLAEQRKTLLSALGLEPLGTGALCELYAAPFTHGPSLAAEVRRLHDRFEPFGDEAQLRTAHAQLHQMDGEAASLLEAVAQLQYTGVHTDDLASMASTQRQREQELSSKREHAKANATAEVEQGRAAFEEELAERTQAANRSTDRLQVEAVAATSRQFKSMANSMLGEIQSVSNAAWQEFMRSGGS
ncbi:hypothetical protein AB1Y20_021901 [Prymnesium parvum]|uniref:Uncharacterized protein n=1 Tax=Prymnesium parvum TaxID=97485 RepID=A0AB34JFB0_PRYPA|mmetsp:Transcript_37004/g.92070  ORF Transcript_37004/g.92070 Transcript_37004/m.92070 type:complete len:189 (+) Transcript_37004:25-591(+)|eukprot:CAMPEP_0184395892 /NCGR_PEP_ID=MMETSP0007-20130409/46460_1 /TAXON_ID=97485 /ORGANISM="Prymnesium parvum, Strain Texoma1" /LENGTH=188 /DNA_ID=CAMNT_0026748363 /DNA_START=22 /DNA_END=588 /DNA_ORIENTATION=-